MLRSQPESPLDPEIGRQFPEFVIIIEVGEGALERRFVDDFADEVSLDFGQVVACWDCSWFGCHFRDDDRWTRLRGNLRFVLVALHNPNPNVLASGSSFRV